MLRPHGAVAGEQLSAIPGSARGSLGSVALLIPSWKPTHTLPALVADLGQRGFGPIVIVDDGSPDACRPVFADVMLIPA